jgi:hypothetical protein
MEPSEPLSKLQRAGRARTARDIVYAHLSGVLACWLVSHPDCASIEGLAYMKRTSLFEDSGTPSVMLPAQVAGSNSGRLRLNNALSAALTGIRARGNLRSTKLICAGGKNLQFQTGAPPNPRSSRSTARL